MSWRQEIGTNNGIKITENHADVGLGPTPKDHIDAETVPTLRSHINEVSLIPKSRIDKETICIRMGMLAEVRTLPRIKGLTMQL